METVDYCFFCCKYIRNDDNSFGCDTENNTTVKEQVLRITHFLKVPREVVKETEGISPLIKTCRDCTKISGKLSDYCIQLEIIRMKISHHLKLLAGQIIGSSTEDQGRPPNLTNLQKLVHQNCLLKVRNDEETSNPQICLEKCSTLLISEDLPPEATDVDIKIENNPVESCPFCDFVTTGPSEIICCHIETAHDHPEQIQTEQVEMETAPFEDDRNVLTADLNLDQEHILPESASTTIDQPVTHSCQNCRLVFNSKAMLDRHQTVHQKLDCGKCGAIFKNLVKLQRHHDKCVLLNDQHLWHCQKCSKTFETRRGLNKHIQKLACDPRSCDCGLVFTTRTGLQNHQRGKCKPVISNAN